ncbi:HAD hydrolase family protein [Streptomyces laculatispora]|uniref:HAD hydrolase family protein n=1 Tax=Streptomyces laculatispora TaxID=887464 RepID=UPI001F5EEF73|nr:HAD hydrolase family protein [Streptomyces laculatispora]
MLLPRLIASDLDGTLPRDDGTLSPRTLRAAEAIAFGDMTNGLTVLDRAGTGYAMAHAHPGRAGRRTGAHRQQRGGRRRPRHRAAARRHRPGPGPPSDRAPGRAVTLR